MTTQTERAAASERLSRFLSFLAEDPANAPLTLEAAEAAFSAGEPEMALSLIDRQQAREPLSAGQLGQLGLAALTAGTYAAAADLYRRVVAMGEDGGAVCYNLAYAEAKIGRFDEALALLRPDVAQGLPQAATLEVQLLHGRGEFETAFETARHYLTVFPGDTGLLAATSTLALDNEDITFARDCALRAGNHPDALTSLGTISLAEADPPAALELFSRSLALNDQAPRSWIGQGLARLASGDAGAAADDIDRGAQLFGDHIGSWLAAGWARLIGGDLAAAAQRFEQARQIDPSFGETLGSLAVIDAMQGRIEDARHKSLAALRLDRESFTALFAQSLIQAAAGNEDNARKIFEALIETPVGAGGLTVRRMMSSVAGLRS